MIDHFTEAEWEALETAACNAMAALALCGRAAQSSALCRALDKAEQLRETDN